MTERAVHGDTGARAHRRTLLALLGIALAAVACSAGDPASPPSPPAGIPRDATSPDDAVVPAPVDATIGDSGLDAGALDGGALDATAEVGPDAGPEGAAPEDGGAETGPDAGPSCAAILGAMLSAPIAPPGEWFGLSLGASTPSDGGPPTAAPTVDQLGLLACATSVEPDVLPAGVTPNQPGYRTAFFAASPDAGVAAALVTLEFNLESRIPRQPAVYAGYSGALTFQSRAGGAYGTHQYSITLESPTDAGSGVLLRDGVSFAADWNDATGNAWLNELYDGLMATFAPSFPPVADCATSTFASDLFGLSSMPNDCLFLPGAGDNGGYIGIRPLGLYLVFAPGSNQVIVVYEFLPAGLAQQCATPRAALELMAYSSIYPTGVGWQIGGVSTGAVHSNAGGLTVSEANTVLGCVGVPWTPPDDGYAGMTWGGGVLAMEYNPATRVNYKVYAQSGYKGLFQSQTTPQGDAGAQYYQIGVGTLQVGALDEAGASVDYVNLAIDWTSVATADATVTRIANAFYDQNCGAPPDADCVSQGDCTIVVDDGNGHSSFTLAPTGAAGAGPYCQFTLPAIAFVFPQGSSTPEQISVVNPGGQVGPAPADDAGLSAAWCGTYDASLEYDASGFDGGSFSAIEPGADGSSGALPGPVPPACSGSGTTTATLTVTNNAPCPIELWWVDFHCQEVFYEDVPPNGASVAQGTFVTHAWRLRAPGTHELLAEIPPVAAASDAVTYP